VNEWFLLLSGSALTSLVTWIITRRKVKVELQGKELDNSAKICLMWKNLSEGMEKRFMEEIDDLKEKNTILENQIQEVLYENVLLRKRLYSIEQENNTLKEKLNSINSSV
jgi:hypothetical protein